jgi:heterotetrameric sarcosine oxidase delta subunit
VSFILSCPNCGPRPVDEYSYGGEVTVRATDSEAERELFHYLYFRNNTAADQREWWFHSSGCREWFQAERNTTRNEVLAVVRPGGFGAPAAADASAASEAAGG